MRRATETLPADVQRAMIMAIARYPTAIDRRDLTMLVRIAYRHEEISVGKVSELLGLSTEEAGWLCAGWTR